MKTYFQFHEDMVLDGETLDSQDMMRTLGERLVILGKGKQEAQAVILAGGAGSGKTFVANNYMEGGKFKMLNPDDIKEIILSIRDKSVAAEVEGKSGMKLTPSMQAMVSAHRNTKLSVSKDSMALHQDIRKSGMDAARTLAVFKEPIERLERSSREMGGMFKAAPLSDVARVVMDPKAGPKSKTLTDRLPNVIFDSSMRSMDHLMGSDPNDPGIITLLRKAGYRSENIHIVWVLTDYKVAYRQNLTRSRVMGADIFLSAHRGVSGTMSDIMFNSYQRLGINGDLVMVVGGRNMQIQYEAGTHYDWKGREFTVPQTVILSPTTKEFKYFRLKRAGSPELNPQALQAAKRFLETTTPSPSETKNDLESSQIKRIMLDFNNIERIVSELLLKEVPTWKIHSDVRTRYPFVFDKTLSHSTAKEFGLRSAQYLPLLSKATAAILRMQPDQYRIRLGSPTDPYIERVTQDMARGKRAIGFKASMAGLDSLAKSLSGKEST